jgi:hypothetical protein
MEEITISANELNDIVSKHYGKLTQITQIRKCNPKRELDRMDFIPGNIYKIKFIKSD